MKYRDFIDQLAREIIKIGLADRMIVPTEEEVEHQKQSETQAWCDAKHYAISAYIGLRKMGFLMEIVEE